MGQQSVDRDQSAEALRQFKRSLLADLRALETLIEEGRIESGVRRIGAEQEVCLLDQDLLPAYCNLAILEHLDREHFTTEVGRYNIELNLDPQNLDGGCLDRLEAQLRALLEELRAKAAAQGVETLLVGILPTLEMSDLTLEGMTPVPRYYAINEAMGRLAGGEYHLRIRGQDELLIRHDNVMLESCNTSFQVHLQVSAEEFPLLYNTALAIAAPVLAFATNSPMLFGRRLWRETRIALFQQAIDTRPSTQHLREQAPRVSFGRRWVERSVLEIFQEDVARFPALLAVPIEEDAPAVVASGGTPQLRALRLFNGTVYRWVRPCYGISENGKPHLRIENRILPAGPTVIDEMANAALWYGLMRGVPLAYGDITKKLAFGTARENFTAAARLGSGAQLDWPDHPNIPAQQLLAEELLPLARHGLADLGIEGGSIDRYLGVIEERVRRLRTGAVWQVYSWDELGTQGSRTERLAALTASMLSQQREGKPVSEWKLAAPSELVARPRYYQRIEQFMSTELFTVQEEELVDLVAAMMNWRHIRHVPVEDNEQRLVGLVTYRNLIQMLARGPEASRAVPVAEIMHRKVVTVTPQTPTLEALARMRESQITCLPVVEGDRLVGMVTERDFLRLSQALFERELTGRPGRRLGQGAA